MDLITGGHITAETLPPCAGRQVAAVAEYYSAHRCVAPAQECRKKKTASLSIPLEKVEYYTAVVMTLGFIKLCKNTLN